MTGGGERCQEGVPPWTRMLGLAIILQQRTIEHWQGRSSQWISDVTALQYTDRYAESPGESGTLQRNGN